MKKDVTSYLYDGHFLFVWWCSRNTIGKAEMTSFLLRGGWVMITEDDEKGEW